MLEASMSDPTMKEMAALMPVPAGREGEADEVAALAEVLALATSDHRILVTHNVRDFPEIVREWAEAGQAHRIMITHLTRLTGAGRESGRDLGYFQGPAGT